MEPVCFALCVPGQGLATLAVGFPLDYRELWLAVTMGERTGFRLAHGCGSSTAPLSHDLPATHGHFDPPLPCLGCRPTGM